jgi:hypothetical protein
VTTVRRIWNSERSIRFFLIVQRRERATFASSTNPQLFSGQARDNPREFTFHGSLTVSGHTATFTLPPLDVTRPNTGSLTVDIARDESRLSGSIHSGGSLDQIGYIVYLSRAEGRNEPASFVGSESADGRMTGQFGGYVHVVHDVLSISDSCTAAGFSWVLVPE